MPQIFSICHKSSISSDENCFKPRILHVINKLTHQVIYEVYSRGLFENHVSFNSSSLFKTLLSLFNKLSQEPRWLQTIIFHIIAFQCQAHTAIKLIKALNWETNWFLWQFIIILCSTFFGSTSWNIKKFNEFVEHRARKFK